MAKYIVFSDSHGRTENLVKAMDRYPDFQAIFHLGDVGNDAQKSGSDRRIIPSR